MTWTRLGAFAAAIALTVVPLAGCDAADETLSAVDACGDLIEMSLSELREVQENLNDPQRVERAYRDMAERFRDKAAEVQDAEVRRAAREYADKLRTLADAAAGGRTPDLDELVDANRKLADACA